MGAEESGSLGLRNPGLISEQALESLSQSSPQAWPCLPARVARSGLADIFNLCFPLPLRSPSTPGQRSNLEVELHLSVNDGAGEVAVMRRRAGGSASWDSWRSHM